jgi:ribonuclease-3
VQRLLNPLLDAEIDHIVAEQTDRDAKSTLQELTQGRFGITPHYHTINERGPDHDKWFTVEVYLKDKAIGQGEGHSKQLAAQAAAANALKDLEHPS